MNDFGLPPYEFPREPDRHAERMQQKLRRIEQLEQGMTVQEIISAELAARIKNFVAEHANPIAEALILQPQPFDVNLDLFGKQIEAIDPTDELVEHIEEATKALQQGKRAQDRIIQGVQRSEDKLANEQKQYAELTRKLQDAGSAYKRSSSQVPFAGPIEAAGTSMCHYIATGKPNISQ